MKQSATTSKIVERGAPSRIILNAVVGFAVGLAGGLVGLGGAELRLPYLAGTLRLQREGSTAVVSYLNGATWVPVASGPTTTSSARRSK